MNIITAFFARDYHGAPLWAFAALAALLIFEYLLGKFHPKSKSTLALTAAGLKLVGYAAAWMLSKFPPTAIVGEFLKQLFGAALVVCLFTGLAGCGSAMTVTLKAEDTLAVSTSQVAHAVDGADALLEVKTRAILAKDKAAARAYYDGYKPKIEKARGAVHAAQDVISDVESVRSRIPSKDGGTCDNGCTGVSSDLTAWLPALSSVLATLKDTYADLKGLVQ